MTQVKRGNRVGPQSLGGRDHYCVNETEIQGPVLPGDHVRAREVRVLAKFDDERTVYQIARSSTGRTKRSSAPAQRLSIPNP